MTRGDSCQMICSRCWWSVRDDDGDSLHMICSRWPVMTVGTVWSVLDMTARDDTDHVVMWPAHDDSCHTICSRWPVMTVVIWCVQDGRWWQLSYDLFMMAHVDSCHTICYNGPCWQLSYDLFVMTGDDASETAVTLSLSREQQNCLRVILVIWHNNYRSTGNLANIQICHRFKLTFYNISTLLPYTRRIVHVLPSTWQHHQRWKGF